ncbi:DUF1990 domain-containing protein [Janibacter melonis]|uniref:DUF1990 family protein n=1 Tax=Janibacter melonis TaxID=262209 RepID=UPI001781FE80|nr:DUF1990 domain-containing protein [Janibacter melonis]
MLTVRADLASALREAATTRPGPGVADWLTTRPSDGHHVERVVELPLGSDVVQCADELMSWGVHRRAGLRVEADADVQIGADVVLGLRLGPVVVVAPCRVTSVVREEDRTGFEYTTLPGHPEIGVERFEVVHDEQGARVEISAVSRPAFLGSRLAPFVSRRVQAMITQRYLDAARAAATGS